MSDYLDLAEIALRIIEKSKKKSTTRRSFSKATKDQVLKNQDNRCKACGKKSDVWDYDHVDGNNSNNGIENCQAMCPNCHAKKTRKITKKRKIKISKVVKTLKKLLKD